MDSSGPKVCAGVAMALSAAFTVYELTWLVESPGMAVAMIGLGLAVFLASLGVLLLSVGKS